MRGLDKMRLAICLLAFAGAALFTALLIHQGVRQVLDAFVRGGWGILGVVVYHLVPLFLDAAAWWALFPRVDRPSLHQLFWMRWIGESVSALVPSAAVGGDIARAFGGHSWRPAGRSGRHGAGGHYAGHFSAGRLYVARPCFVGGRHRKRQFGRPDLGWNLDRAGCVCRLLLRAAPRDF